MKKLVKVLLLVCIMASMFCLSAYAEDELSDSVSVSYYSNTYNQYMYDGSDPAHPYRGAFQFNMESNDGKPVAKTSLEIELYYEDTLLSKTMKKSVAETGITSVTCNIVVFGDPSGSWDTQWAVALDGSNYPNKIRVIGDGKKEYVFENATRFIESEFPEFNPPSELVPLSPTVLQADVKPIAVIKDGNVVGYYDDLASAIGDAPTGSLIELQEGTYKMVGVGGKELSFAGAPGTDPAKVKVEANTVTGHSDGSVNFSDLTIIAPNANYTGMQHLASATFSNCIIENEFWSYATHASFSNCTFNQTSSDRYNIWTYGSSVVDFDNCTFNSAGKSVLVYREAGINSTVTANDCDFNASDMVAGKAAIEIDSSFPNGNPNDYGYTIKLNNCTASGFDPNSLCGNELWNNKKGEKTTVFNNNKQVYPALPEAPAKAPVSNRYNVPSTADNSNVPLWAVLFLGFAAVAVVTAGKKRRS